MPTTYDHREIRCPRLGGEVHFSYCRRENGDLPCPRTVICWQAFFPVEQYLMDNMTPEDLERFSEQPKDKVTTLLDLIEAAKKRKQKA